MKSSTMTKVIKIAVIILSIIGVCMIVLGLSKVLVKNSFDSSEIIKSNKDVASKSYIEENSPIVDNRKDLNINENVINKDEYVAKADANYKSYGVNCMKFDTNKYDIGNTYAYGVPYSVYNTDNDVNGMHLLFGDLTHEVEPIIKQIKDNKDKYFSGLDDNFEKNLSDEVITNWLSSGDTAYVGKDSLKNYDYIQFTNDNASGYGFFDNYYVVYSTDVGNYEDKVLVFVDYSKRAFSTSSNYIEDFGIVDGGFNLYMDNCNIETINGWTCYFIVDNGPLYIDRKGVKHSFDEVKRGDKIDW